MITLNDVIARLAARCDGARKRDNQGFDKNDTFGGHRLDAMTTAGLLWDHDMVKQARRLVAHYAVQAAGYFTNDNDKRTRLVQVFRNPERMETAAPAVSEAANFRYAALSPEKRALWLLPGAYDAKLVRDIQTKLKGLEHGERRIANPFFNRQRQRWELPYNGTTRPILLSLLHEHSFIWDREINCGLDATLDDLMRHARAAFLADKRLLSSDGSLRPHVVFDTDGPVPPFVEAVKARVPYGLRDYDPGEGVWHVLLTRETKPVIADLVATYGFEAEAALKRTLAG